MKKRYLVYLSFVILIYLGFSQFQPVLPVIQVPGEVLIPWGEGTFLQGLFGDGFTNTFLATMITYGIMFALIIVLRARSRTADEVPTGFYNVFEAIIEGAYNFVQSLAGAWARQFFPFFMTFTLLILVANWMELFPGVDSIGIWEDIPHHKAELAVRDAVRQAAAEGRVLSQAEMIEIEHAAEERYHGTGDLRRPLPSFLRVLPIELLMRADQAVHSADERNWTIVPFVRVPATDLNFTLALALVSVISIQYFGFRNLGTGYLTKFFNFRPQKIAKNPLGAMDPIVGFLELISEVARVLSFAFRLFGVIFAGQVLLFVIAFLLPVGNVGVYLLEFFVGAVQALVFAMLTLIFMTMAVQPHHDEGDHH